MHEIKKINKNQKFISKNDSTYLYGLMPVWKAILKIGSTGILMSFFLGLFTFADQLMLVNFMPDTLRFCFNNLFFVDHNDIFKPIIQDLQNQSINNKGLLHLYNQIISQKNTKGMALKNLVLAIANTNGLGIYNSDSIVRSAVSLTVALSDIVYILPSLYSIGVSIKYSQALGRNDYRSALYIWQNAFIGTISVTLIGCIITFILIPLLTPAQATIDLISDKELQKTQLAISTVLQSNNFTNSYYLYEINNEIYEKFYFILNKNNECTYLIKISKNDYINISNFALNTLSNSNINEVIVNNLHPISSFSIKLVNYNNHNDYQNVTNIWNNYFNTVRNYSITWAEDFLYIVNAGLIIASISNLLITILRSDGAIMIATIISIVPIILNIVLDYILIVYAQIGMDGAAVSTLCGWVMQVVWTALYIQYSKHLKTVISWSALNIKYLVIRWKMLWELCMYGGTVFLGNLGWMITDILLTNQVTEVSDILLHNTGSEYYLSIMGAILPIANLFVVTIIGFLQFVSPIFSFNFAAKNYKRFHESFWYTTLFTFLFTFSIYFIICYIDEVIIGILSWFKITQDSANLELYSAIKLLRIWFIQIPVYTFSIGAMLSYLSSNRPGLSTIIGLIRSCILFIPILYIFSSIAINYSASLNYGLNNIQINNPYTNNAMWFFMWNVAASYMISSILVFFLTIFYIYKYLAKSKRHILDCFPFKLIKNYYLKKYLNEL